MTYEQYMKCVKDADERMKTSNGHSFVTILKTRCEHCGRSRNVKTKCGGWFQTFVDRLGIVLQEQGVIEQ